MAYFWLVIALVLLVTIGYAAHADLAARREGKVLVPVRQSFGRRTIFVRMDRADLKEQKLAMLVARQEQDRAERAETAGRVTRARLFDARRRRGR